MRWRKTANTRSAFSCRLLRKKSYDGLIEESRGVDKEMCTISGLTRPAVGWILLAAINGLISVAAGAFARHAMLDAGSREMIAIGSQYQMTHGLALFGVAWFATQTDLPWLSPVHLAGAGFALGILLFCGSLYWLGITGDVPLRGAAPVGGFLLMLGWLAVGVAAVRSYLALSCSSCGVVPSDR